MPFSASDFGDLTRKMMLFGGDGWPRNMEWFRVGGTLDSQISHSGLGFGGVYRTELQSSSMGFIPLWAKALEPFFGRTDGLGRILFASCSRTYMLSHSV
ncbi:hypothetical protein BVC80_1717g69 [Macleaya cordata]|uniref:Uncharacterized protein n=1 Tax=Macleaya cordata TaxID=56857 RepID=A0A200Q215_MACCD|nr:hypothetical protein BVC80_1717g69 [Macleaya cordata]